MVSLLLKSLLENIENGILPTWMEYCGWKSLSLRSHDMFSTTIKVWLGPQKLELIVIEIFFAFSVNSVTASSRLALKLAFAA